MPTRFSIIIPVYNRREVISRALLSIQAQTFTDFEVIVVDDGSVDDPSSAVAYLRDERFKCVAQEHSGAAAARNCGARLAKGDLITFLDSDDEAFPTWLETMDRGFRQHQASIVCCGLEKTDGKNTQAHFPGDMGKAFDHAKARFTNGGVFAMQRHIFNSIGGYATELRSGQHTELAMRLLPVAKERQWKIHNIMEPLVRIHVHGGPRIRTNPHAIFAGSTYVINKHRALLKSDPQTYSNYHAVAGVNAARVGLLKESRYHLRQAAFAQPYSLKAWLRMTVVHLPWLARLRWRCESPGLHE
jgi:glycosyltransferase involved in cell wall biosynthesis